MNAQTCEASEGSKSRQEEVGLIGFNLEVKLLLLCVRSSAGDTIIIAKGLQAKIMDREAGEKDFHEL